jgi:hypothetical protein
MKRADKIALLTQALAGKVAKLHELKQAQPQKVFLFVVDDYPKDWFGNLKSDDTPVKVTRHLQNGTEVIEYLTYAQMLTKSKGAILTLIPDNHRRSGG